MKVMKLGLVLIVILTLSGCVIEHTPKITSYEPSDSERNLLQAAGIQNYFLYHYNLEENDPPSKVEFWIDLYAKGQQVDEIHRTFDYSGMGNKGKIGFFLPESTNRKLVNYRITIGNDFGSGASSMDALKDVGTLSEPLSGASEWGTNTKATIKLNHPIILAVEVFSLSHDRDNLIDPLDDKLYSNPNVLGKVKRENVVIVYKCQFDSK